MQSSLKNVYDVLSYLGVGPLLAGLIAVVGSYPAFVKIESQKCELIMMSSVKTLCLSLINQSPVVATKAILVGIGVGVLVFLFIHIDQIFQYIQKKTSI